MTWPAVGLVVPLTDAKEKLGSARAAKRLYSHGWLCSPSPSANSGIGGTGNAVTATNGRQSGAVCTWSTSSPAGQASSDRPRTVGLPGFYSNGEDLMGRHKKREPSTRFQTAQCGPQTGLLVFENMDPCGHCHILTKASLMDCCYDCGEYHCLKCVGDCKKCRLPVCRACWENHKAACDALNDDTPPPPDQRHLWSEEDYQREHMRSMRADI